MLEGVADRITSLIDRIGRDVEIRTIVDSGTPYNATQTPSDDPARAAIIGFKAHETDGSIIQAQDKKAYISSTESITKKDKIVDQTIEYQIIDLRTVQPGDEKFLYIAQLRR